MRTLTLAIALAVGLAGCRGTDAPRDAAPPAAPAAAQPAAPPAAAPAADPTLASEPAPVDTLQPSTAATEPPAGAVQPAPPSGSAAAQPAAPQAQVSGPTVAAPAPAEPPAPRYREITLPEGTELALTLESAVASDTSRVEDSVRASLRRAIVIDDVRVVPSGTQVRGSVIDVARSAKVKGRARIALRFTEVVLDGERLDVRTSSVRREARSTKKKDAAKVGVPAAGGAILGAIIGGGKGAAIGATVGGGAGTAAVMATRGEEVRLPAGTPVTVRLTAPVTVRIRID
jgi:outer membrane lipoprotein SlyB